MTTLLKTCKFCSLSMNINKYRILKLGILIFKFLSSSIFSSKTTSLLQLYIQPYLQGYPPFANMRGLYHYLTAFYEFIYKENIMDVNTWPKLSHVVVGFMSEFTNVTLRGPHDFWFKDFKNVFGKLFL